MILSFSKVKRNCKQKGLIFMDINIASRKRSALVDTGASNLFISKKVMGTGILPIRFASKTDQLENILHLENGFQDTGKMTCNLGKMSYRFLFNFLIINLLGLLLQARKNLSIESINYPFGEEFKIETVEDEKSDLQNRLREEVAILKEELQRERDNRATLESVLNSSQEQPTVLPAKIDEKADLNDIALVEADIINLKKKVEDLEVQLNQQLEKKSASINDSCSQRQPNHHAKKEDKPKGTGAFVKESGSKAALPITSEPAVVHLCLKWLLLLRKLLERRPGDATAVYPSTEKAQKELGWKAKYGIAEMCRDQWKWASNNPWGY
ncbi:hypothetical protein PVK06_009588 [Gossypium arboreum]|uniref:Ternary complex factor MIP1 leucine-zipper domain-containing protein n=1 Tax=Gossypium arboreum TaxID=29729 RepID=A0ABR0QMX1_GOSAR|nr:hypothetical protein PVK06_009588 [Gossypium arboreum]